MQNAAGAPQRIEDRFVLAARDATRAGHRSVRTKIRNAQVGRVEWHVGVIPVQPGEPPAFGIEPRRSVEVPAAENHPGLR